MAVILYYTQPLCGHLHSIQWRLWLDRDFTFYIVTGSIERSAKRRYISYSEADFEVFRPTEATRCTDGSEIWHRGVHWKSTPPWQISPHRCNNKDIGPLKLIFYHEICRVCTSFQDALTVKIWMDLLRGVARCKNVGWTTMESAQCKSITRVCGHSPWSGGQGPPEAERFCDWNTQMRGKSCCFQIQLVFIPYRLLSHRIWVIFVTRLNVVGARWLLYCHYW